MPYPAVGVEHSTTGPLNGLKFAVKDVFDVVGYPTSAGNPLWLAQSGIKNESAQPVVDLLAAGASFCAKTVTDEFAYSIIGDNAHFGAPINASAESRFTGGSSSGSAAAVAHGLVDFSLGTDTGGSVRAPASNCGIFGLRPSYGHVSLSGVHALAPSFDTCGWFARDLDVLARVTQVLLNKCIEELTYEPAILRPFDLWALVRPDISETFRAAETSLQEVFGASAVCQATLRSPQQMVEGFRVIQGFEAWEIHGAWLSQYQPKLGPGVKERFKWASSVSREQYLAALRFKRDFTSFIGDAIGESGVLIIPTVGDIAPLRSASFDALEAYRGRCFSLLCVAGLAGLPQLSLPVARYQGSPVGLSLIGPVGSDTSLIAIAKKVASWQ
jgi:amidase